MITVLHIKYDHIEVDRLCALIMEWIIVLILCVRYLIKVVRNSFI